MRRRHRLGLSVAVFVVVGFAAWAVVQWFAVERLRDELSVRVQCLSAISDYRKEVRMGTGDRPVAGELQSRCRESLPRDDMLWAGLEVSGPQEMGKPLRDRDLGHAVARVRSQSADISQQLGNYWDGLVWLVGGLVLLCFGTLSLLHLAYRRGRKLEAARRELHDLATHDALTRTLNRRVLMDNLAGLLTQSEQKLSLLLIDLDHFKRINDNFGHLAGDEVLRATTRLLQERLQPSGSVLGRYGGEEFVAIIEGAGYDDARTVAEELRQAVASASIRLGDDEVGVTVSIGIAVRGADISTCELLIERADQALYAAKSAGRNRVA